MFRININHHALLAFVCMAFLPHQVLAQLRVDVAQDFQTYLSFKYLVQAGPPNPIRLEDYQPGDLVQVLLSSSEPGAAFVIDLIPESEWPNFLAARQGLKAGPLINEGPDQGRFRPVPIPRLGWNVQSAGPYLLVISSDRRWWGKRPVKVDVLRRFHLSEEKRQELTQYASNAVHLLDSMFVLKPFTVRVLPCNEPAAWSDLPNITLCTERIAGTSDGAFLGVLFHEAGHSLLYLWGELDWNYEIAADDFAIWLLMQLPNGPGLAGQLAEDFQKWADLETELGAIFDRGDQHPLSPQRIQNIWNRRNAPDEFMKERNRAFYPRMRNEYLQRIIADPHPYEDPRLAAQVLASRQLKFW